MTLDRDMQAALEQIRRETNSRYGERLERHGASPLALGWDTDESMRIRFDVALSACDFRDKVVIDVGCGLAGLLERMVEREIRFRKYVGIDINEHFLDRASELARRRAPGRAEFHLLERMLEPFTEAGDIVVLLGLLNFRQTVLDPKIYDRAVLAWAYSMCNETMLCDFLSAEHDPAQELDDWVVYRRPEDVLAAGFELSRNVRLLHHYVPLPQREMMLVIDRKGWGART